MNTRRIPREIPSIGQLRQQSAEARGRPVNRSPRTAFVLSGGGNQAVSQVGMLRALLERDIVPDVVVGTSAGALNGSVLAADPTLAAIDHLDEMWDRCAATTSSPAGSWRGRGTSSRATTTSSPTRASAP